MKTKARLVAESVRLKQWSQQIRECQNRPAGLTVDEAGNYKSQLLLSAPLRPPGDTRLFGGRKTELQYQIPDFVELPVPTGCLSPALPGEQTMPEKSAVSAVIRGNNGITVDVFPETPQELLHALVRALAHA